MSAVAAPARPATARPTGAAPARAAERLFGDRLPEGETVLWTGRPEWRSFLLHALPLRGAWIWIVGCGTLLALTADTGPARVAQLGWTLVVGLTVTALGAGFAWLVSRSTEYAFTDRRVAMRTGIALPGVLNIPFRNVRSVDLRAFRGGTGDVPLTLGDGAYPGWLFLWPHVRPWRMNRPDPAFRAIAEAADVGERLAAAIEASAHRRDDA